MKPHFLIATAVTTLFALSAPSAEALIINLSTAAFANPTTNVADGGTIGGVFTFAPLSSSLSSSITTTVGSLIATGYNYTTGGISGPAAFFGNNFTYDASGNTPGLRGQEQFLFIEFHGVSSNWGRYVAYEFSCERAFGCNLGGTVGQISDAASGAALTTAHVGTGTYALAAPEPAALALFGLGAATLGLARRRRG